MTPIHYEGDEVMPPPHVSRGAFKLLILGAIALACSLCGCRISPVPREIERYYSLAHAIEPQLRDQLKPGDVLFRHGHLDMGLWGDLGDWMAGVMRSPFSHVAMVQTQVGDDWVIATVDLHGVQRQFLIDFLIEGENLVVKRLRPEYANTELADGRTLLDHVLENLDRMVAADSLSNDSYRENDDRLYCSELIDEAFRRAGYPLAEKVRIRDLPGLPFYASILAEMLDANLDDTIAVPGNEDYGIYASPMLFEVVNYLPGTDGYATLGISSADGG